MTPLTRCLQRYAAPAAPATRLVCFPHAGGGASGFRQWAGHLPGGVELLAVQYPGREERIAEPPATDLCRLASEVAHALARLDPAPTVLFGHSLGAAVAFETARRLPSPVLLVVSGRQAPVDPGRSVHLMSGDELWQDVARSGGTRKEVLDSDELRALLLPVLRADYRLSETYRPAPLPLLACPVLACSGDRDPEVDPAALDGWRAVTTGTFTARLFPGDHFYLVRQRGALIAEVLRTAWSLPAAAAWPSTP
ncbi:MULTISPECIES: alpha/beta fold hydrolase [unclassified Micromonospora]|uniref:thioesterase II family protein n=1 Tax=unclassified Micromonospora TaxID=2617518 RepID=UPI001C23B9B5|nr:MULTISPECIES: alpha/beta fold hydrolase [unclassified Micromonospora]MBU8860441.1 alpha/beta fold hydrolase [Micromonospora sp. WMMB482]MDM4779978.1 alpha/beta fold hydrolase [Micromonospora sp. b486]